MKICDQMQIIIVVFDMVICNNVGKYEVIFECFQFIIIVVFVVIFIVLGGVIYIIMCYVKFLIEVWCELMKFNEELEMWVQECMQDVVCVNQEIQ